MEGGNTKIVTLTTEYLFASYFNTLFLLVKQSYQKFVANYSVLLLSIVPNIISHEWTTNECWHGKMVYVK